MSITHTFLDFIPSIFLGAPEEDNFLSVLPGHKLLLDGRGQEAAVITLYGCLAGIIIAILITPIFAFTLPFFFNSIKLIIPYILIFISLFIIFREENFLLSILIFSLAGYLGYITFNLPVKEPLLPLLSGLFGLSNLIISINEDPKFVEQKIIPFKEIKIPKSIILKTSLIAGIVSPLCSFLPGIGSGHAATLGSEISDPSPKRFLFLVGAINVIVMTLSFVTAYSIQKTRTGSAAVVQTLLQKITLSQLSILLLTAIISAIIAFIVGIQLSKLAAKFINKINYKLITLIVMIIIILVNILFSNALGLMVLFTATFLGIFTIRSGARRINLMGSLLISSILYYLVNS